MRIETFRQRLQSGKSVNYHYQANGKMGLLAIWFNESKFVLTWEECLDGDLYNEQNYTRDEVHHFTDVKDVLAFLEVNKINPEQFKP